MTKTMHVGLSLATAEDFRHAALPLFEEEIVDALEWNVDLGWTSQGIPTWAEMLLDAYSAEGRLYAHGVELSLLTAVLQPRQERWLACLAEEVKRRRYVHLSEHFGFMTAGAYVNGTPLPHPMSEAAIAVGRERIARLAEIAGVPIGLENLALAFSRRDVDEQPDFIEALLAPSGGFLLLDLHNLYCQAVNFEVAPEQLLERYPLSRVREIHVAGGAWSHPRSDGGRPFRRDTHESDVPEEVFPLLERAIAACPRLEVVILERSDGSIRTAAEVARFRESFRRIRALVKGQT